MSLVEGPPAGASPDGAELSVIIVNWNARDVLLGCLDSLRRNPPPVPWEVIVVDNGSVDGSVERLRAAAPWVRLIANEANRGLPAANNQGMLAAQGALLLICNPDVVFGPGAVKEMVEALGRHPRAAWVVPRLQYEDGTLMTSAGDLPRLRDALLGRQRQRARASAEGFWWDGWAHDEERQIGRGHEAAYLVRRAAVVDIGLQDEGYPLDWEGLDWSARVRQRGWEIWFCPGADVVHLGGVSIRQAPFRWVVLSHRGMYRYFSRRRPVWVRPVLAAAVGLRAATKLVATAAGAAMYERGHRAKARHG